QRLRRDLLAALRARRVLRARVHAAAAPAARAAALDALPDRAAGAGLPAGRDPAREDHRAVAGGGGALGARRAGARIQPRRVARVDGAAADEHRGLRRRLPAVPGVAALLRAQRRHSAAAPAERAADVRTGAGGVRRRPAGVADALLPGLPAAGPADADRARRDAR